MTVKTVCKSYTSDATRTPLSGSHRDRVVFAIDLVDALAPGYAHGHAFMPELSPSDVARPANAAFAGLSDSQSGFEPSSTPETLALAVSLHRIFLVFGAEQVPEAIAHPEHDAARTPSAPHLSVDEPWSLHYHDHTLPTHAGWSTGCAAALGSFVSSGHWAYLGSCEAVACNRVFLDITRNTSRRYCSVRCQNREKVRAFRQQLAQWLDSQRPFEETNHGIDGWPELACGRLVDFGRPPIRVDHVVVGGSSWRLDHAPRRGDDGDRNR